MSDSPALSILNLPIDLTADDLIGHRDQLGALIGALVVSGKGRKRHSDVTLPQGVEALDALPPHIERPWKRFDAAVTALQAFRASRATAQADGAHAASDETEQTAANAAADDRWRALEQWNAGAAGLADDGAGTSPTEARWLYAQLFPQPEGLRFITRRPRTQWTAMEQRMTVLKSSRAHAVLSDFGGKRHHDQLVASHARFGKAYGFTAAVIAPAGGPTDGRPQWAQARDALRTLVQKIESYADPESEGSEALVSFLLGPYVEMVADLEKSRRARPKKAEPTPAPSPS